jgi:hypothetical protein
MNQLNQTKMKEFLLVFRRDFVSSEAQPSPEQLQQMMKPWEDWMGSLAAQDKLVSSGNRLSSEVRVVKPDKTITNGPFVELKEAVGGYIMVRANSIDEAAELSKDCPILQRGGKVEVRTVVPMDDNS